MIFVPGSGPASAKLAIVGEAPGAEEERQGIPFVGKSGAMVDNYLKTAGMPREYCYVTNVVKVRPPGNDIKKLGLLGKSIDDYLPQLWAELEALQPNCILAFGNTALTALTGQRGIEKYRGSLLQTIKGNFKVIPTIHPASLMHKEADGKMRSWKDTTFIQWDVEKAVKQAQFKEYNPPIRNLIVAKNNLTLYRFLDRFSNHEEVAVDIETFRTIPICISFAFNSTDSISIPFFNQISVLNELGMTRSDILQCWKDVADVLANPRIRKIGQNFKFDQLQLERCYNRTVLFGMPIRSFYFDTMLAFRTLYPELPGKLEFQTSILTNEPYYKEEGKGYNPKKDKLERLLLYNAKDSVVTFECKEREHEELRERGLEEFFFTRVMPLHSFYRKLEGNGIRRDPAQHRFLHEKYKLQDETIGEELSILTTPYGISDVNVNSNGMNGQVAKLIYGAMGIKARKGTDEKTLDAIIRNDIKVNKSESKTQILKKILERRKIKKTISTYVNARPHDDGKLRTGVRIMLESGRTSTSILKPPVTTDKYGVAFQTLTKHGEVGSDLRSMYIPDEGYIFIEPDLSQAEARVVAVLARDEKLMKMFQYGVDVHCVTSNWVNRICDDSLLNQFFAANFDDDCIRLTKEINGVFKAYIPTERRQEGKKFRHAGHYDMGKREASEQIGIPEWKAGQILEKFHATNPNIKGVFHTGIREFLRDNQRTLRNPFGRVRTFLNKWGDDLFKEAYAQIPQSTVSDQMKFAMIRILNRIEREYGFVIDFLMESHDSFLAQVRETHLEKVIPIIKEELEVPIDFKNCSLSRNVQLIIPTDIKIGYNWEDASEENPQGLKRYKIQNIKENYAIK